MSTPTVPSTIEPQVLNARPIGGEPPESDASFDKPIRVTQFGRTDWIELAIAATAGISAAVVLCVLMDWRHPLTFGIWAMLSFLAVEWVLVRDRAGGVVANDRLMTAAIWSTAVIAVGVLAWMIIYVVVKGLAGLSPGFFTEDLSESGPLNPGGGALHAIIGTLEQVGIAAAVAVPLAILTAVYLHEVRGRMSGVVRFAADAMSGLPSIVAGLMVYTLWVTGRGFSGFAGSLALVVVMLPIVTRAAEEILRTVSPDLREASLALGAPQWRTVTQVVLPTAKAGLVTASILGVARVVGETAPVLLTALGSASVNNNPFVGQQADLPLFIFSLLKQPNEVQIQRAWAGAFVLVLLVMVLFVVARVIANRGAHKLGGRR